MRPILRAAGRELLPRPPAAHALGPVADDVRAAQRGLVDHLHEDPLLAAGARQREAAGELVAVELDDEVAGLLADELRRRDA
jgi:hypothetical protein